MIDPDLKEEKCYPSLLVRLIGGIGVMLPVCIILDPAFESYLWWVAPYMAKSVAILLPLTTLLLVKAGQFFSSWQYRKYGFARWFYTDAICSMLIFLIANLLIPCVGRLNVWWHLLALDAAGLTLLILSELYVFKKMRSEEIKISA